jgi:hypothetical protein
MLRPDPIAELVKFGVFEASHEGKLHGKEVQISMGLAINCF